jgi:hypothetical protein
MSGTGPIIHRKWVYDKGDYFQIIGAKMEFLMNGIGKRR